MKHTLATLWGISALLVAIGTDAAPIATAPNDGVELSIATTNGRIIMSRASCSTVADTLADLAKTDRERQVAKWMKGQVGYSFAVMVDNERTPTRGCYHRVADGFSATPALTRTSIFISEKNLTGASAAAVTPVTPATTPAPLNPPQMPEFEPSANMADLLRAHLESAPPGMRENFLFEGRPATLWQLSCKQIAQFQATLARTDKDRAYVTWQAAQPGQLLTVLRIDGTTSESCYVPTSRGIRIFSKGQQPFDSTWQ
ncbi:hypothetical protein [Caballeronia novacaledonica]|uniref:Uncharacterized protein n=1 Tax=Caballeronia novacaledonica TaxID=1544861 RepID=A0AA37IE10_9BURK|nr:hypothetical protein [Caballeronia novacaledonica]GJH28161.1 hypothetical protein CBA19CS42_26615 [Caballeronia novacaledonica]